MAAYTIDTLATAGELEQAGFKTEQAKAVARAIAHQGEDLATRTDLAVLEKSLRHEMSGLRWMFGFLFALNLTMFGFLFAVWWDVASLTAG